MNDYQNIKEQGHLGGFEVYRKSVAGTLDFERETLHVSDDQKKIVSIETKTVEDGDVISSPDAVIRYQYDNHLGSSTLELDHTAALISYEEYHPFGTTSYRSGSTDNEVSMKRYKYVGKERDDETGLFYYGARYYAAWLCRFVSVDPLQFDYPQLTPFNYAGNKPITHIDIDGMQSSGDEKITTQPRYSEQRDDDGNLLSKTKEQSSLTLNDDGSVTVHNLKGTMKYNDDGTTSTFVEPYSETVNNSDELSDKGKEYLNLISNYAAEGTKGFIRSQGFNFAETGFSKYNPRQDYFNKLAPLKENLIKGKLSKENYAWARYQAQRSVRSKSSTYGKLIAEVAKTSKQQQQHAHEISRGLKEFPKNAQGTRKSINTLAQYSKSIFRGLTVLSASLSVYDVITSPDPNKAAAQELTGWAGATMGSLSGAKMGFAVGALFGGVGAPIGAIIGGIAGGAFGYWAGAKAGNAAYEKLNH